MEIYLMTNNHSLTWFHICLIHECQFLIWGNGVLSSDIDSLLVLIMFLIIIDHSCILLQPLTNDLDLYHLEFS